MNTQPHSQFAQSLTSISKMKSIIAYIFLFFAVFSHNAIAANLTDEEKEYIAAFQPIADEAANSGISVRVAIIGNYSPKLTKVFMTFKDGQCVLGLNLRNDRNHVDPLDVDAPGVDRRQMLNAVLAHEMGHCFAYTEAKNPNPQPQVSLEESHQEELHADLFALAWTSIYHPEDFQATMSYFKTFRSGLMKIQPEYHGATPAELTAAIEFRKSEVRSNPDFLMKVATGNYK